MEPNQKEQESSGTAEISGMQNLMQRRVPQIVGMYIAGTWMLTEISGWFEERFAWPEWVGSFLFIGLLMMIPSVFAIAYYHGAPGRDEWSRKELSVLGINVILVSGIFFWLTNSDTQVEPEMPTVEVREVVDELGVARQVEVVNQSAKRRVAAFFWKDTSNSPDANNDWLRSGLPYLFDLDLEQNGFISVSHMFNSGYDLLRRNRPGQGSDLPLSLALQKSVARELDAQFFFSGSYQFESNSVQLSIQLYKVGEAEPLLDYQVAGDNLLGLIDQLTVQIVEALALPDNGEQLTTDLPIKERTSGSIEAIRHTVLGNEQEYYYGDYTAAVEHYAAALELDESFAIAARDLAFAYRALGEVEQSTQAIDQALQHEYRLLPKEVFNLKGLRYGNLEQNDKQIALYEMITELYPEESAYWGQLARLYVFVGNRTDKAIEAYRSALEYNPTEPKPLLAVASMTLTQGELDQSLAFIDRYLAIKPNDITAKLMKAQVYRFQGKLDKALAVSQQAQLISTGSDAISALLLESDIHVSTGDVEAAERIFNEALQSAVSDANRAEVLNKLLQYYSYTGRDEEILQRLPEIEQALQTSMAPIQRIITFGTQRAMFHASLEQADAAMASLESTKQQLPEALHGYLYLSYLSVLSALDRHDQMLTHLAGMKTFIEQGQVQTLTPFYLQSKLDYLLHQGCSDIAGELLKEQEETLLSSSINVIQPELKLSSYVSVVEYYVLLGDYDAASRLLAEVIRPMPANAYANLWQTTIALAQNEVDEARDNLSRLEKTLSKASPKSAVSRRFRELQEVLQKVESGETYLPNSELPTSCQVTAEQLQQL